MIEIVARSERKLEPDAMTQSTQAPHPRLAGCLILAAALFCLAGAAHGETLLWSEEFNSSSALECSVWEYDLGDGCAEGICGWGNGEFQEYTDSPSNVRVENGQLIITALRETINGPGDPGPDEYRLTSGRIKTQDRLTMQYGSIEARIQLPDLADGLWPAFWTLGNNIPAVGWPACGEIDIFEMGSSGAISDGVINRRVGSTAHWDVQGNYAGYGLSYTSGSDLNDTFHIYRMEWTPTYISTFIDGIWIWTIDISNPASFGGEEFHQPHFLLLNMAMGGSYTGVTDDQSDVTALLPAEYRVDWIRIYDNGFTTLGGIGSQIDLDLSQTGTDVNIAFSTQSGINYDVLYKTTPSDPDWILIQSVVGSGGTMSVTDAVSSAANYYRVNSYE